ncbi:MAG: hypothetical protein WBA93_17325 [Microcoleaceae cyanobacterium]
MVENDINYKIIKPAEIKHQKIKPGLHLTIKWKNTLFPNSGYIDNHYFSYHRNDQRGDYVELIYKNQIYHNPSLTPTPTHVQPYFDKIWRDIQVHEIFRHPKELRLGNKIANFLPDRIKAYRVKSDDNQCKVARNKQKYCYVKRFRDCEYYVSPTANCQLMSKRANSLSEAIKIALEMINSQEKNS